MTSSKFVTIMEAVGRDIKKTWDVVVTYLPSVEALVEILFPGSAAVVGVVNSVQLIQQAVATVEQKFAAAGAPTGSGPQKLAQVLSLVSPTVTQLLASEGIKVNTDQVTDIVNAVVAILNVQAAPLVAQTGSTSTAPASSPAPAPVAA